MKRLGIFHPLISGLFLGLEELYKDAKCHKSIEYKLCVVVSITHCQKIEFKGKQVQVLDYGQQDYCPKNNVPCLHVEVGR